MRSNIQIFVLLTFFLGAWSLPNDCASESSVYQVYKCLSQFVIPSKAISSDDAFAAIVPNEEEKAAIGNVIPQVLSSSECPDDLGVLQKTLSCINFRDEAVILFEKTTSGSFFLRGWGVLIVNKSPRARIHLFSSNPTSTGSLVASLYTSLKPKSIFVTGVKKDAYRNRAANKCDPSAYPTDGSCNTESFFYQAAASVANWQMKEGCEPGKCTFVHFDRMSWGVCSDKHILLSTGTDSAPRGKIVEVLKARQPSWEVVTDPTLCETTTKFNLLGRLLNGAHDVCTATSAKASGLFLDVQTSGAWSETRLGSSWADAMKEAFQIPGTEGCFISNDVYAVFHCFRDFILPRGHILNLERYKQTLPNAAELKDWQDTIKSMLATGKCPAPLPASLRDQVGCRDLPDAAVLFEKSYSKCREVTNGICVSSSDADYLVKGWGFFAAASSSSYRSVHLSAAHPISDGSVGLQVFRMFQPLRAKSAMVSGTRRDSYLSKADNPCQGDLGKGYYPPDGAHNIETMFHQSLLAIGDWQLSQPGGCPMAKCAFLQYHGMAGNSCPEDVFISTGSNNKEAALEYLSDKSLPIRRVQDAIMKQHPDWNVGTSHTSQCHLFGTTNTYGRVLNGVPRENVCRNNPPSMESFSGLFVHAEQKDRVKNGLDWVEAIASVFPLN